MRQLLPFLPRPSHFLGGEWGAVTKDPASVAARIALAFPDVYEVGMSYLGAKILYEAVNRRDDLAAERVYAPSREAAEVLRAHGAPLCSLESDTPLVDFDALGFHLTTELASTNVLYMLDLAGIPFYAAERDESHPLVMAGGGLAGCAEPLAPFFDVLCLGDGEDQLCELMDEIGRAKAQGLPRRELLRRLSRLPGVYVPAFFTGPDEQGRLAPVYPDYACVKAAVVKDLDAAVFPKRQLVPSGQCVHDRLTLEIARGCTRGCRFCQAGMMQRPVRERSVKVIDELLQDGLAQTGFEEVSFLSLSTGDFTALEEVFAQSAALCLSKQIAISLPSLRAGSLTPDMLALMSKLRRTGATIAPEAGSQRLRDVINKNLTEDDILDHVELLFRHGWQNLKLYFMIGLPGETDDDLSAIVALAEKCARTAGRLVRGARVTVSLSPFVPKPHTPFQWEEQASLEEVQRRVSLVREGIRPFKRITLKWHEPRMTFLEGILSRGGRELAPVVERAYRLGACFDAWVDSLDLGPWLAAMEEAGLSPADYLRARDPSEPLSWDHLSMGVDREFLLAEREKALQAQVTPDCRLAGCRACGACERPKPQLPGQGEGLGLRLNKLQGRVVEKVDLDSLPPPAPFDSSKPKAPSVNAELTTARAWYLVEYSKTGQAAALSQLELTRLFERAFRRAEWPVAFSAGFHPSPLFSFGQALPVGVESLCEWFAAGMRREMLPKDEERLAANLPAGLHLTCVTPLASRKQAKPPVAEGFRLDLLDPSKAEAFAKAWEDFEAAESFAAVFQSKKGSRSRDVRRLVRDISAGPQGSRLFVLDWSEGYVNPLKIVLALLGDFAPVDFRLTKMERFHEPCDLAR